MFNSTTQQANRNQGENMDTANTANFTVLTDDGEAYGYATIKAAVHKAESVYGADWVIEDRSGEVVESGSNYDQGPESYGSDVWY
tara:strand:- start:137 stop:391 length:255 start_codon:yes stop_codon:yes gene_type:complete